ncbi:outer membrane protein assembly factor BamE [Yoonia sp. 208BN28-4]|uniref:outer membrane protein assembly factor BamE n=1 Tax=Yoonia sp. 208BN28-4 TaxID=3126505 RepID=UPI0030B0D27E
MSSDHSKTWQHVRRVILAAGLVAATACTPIIRNHGFAPSDDELSLLQIGVDTRETISDSIGPPTSGGVLDGSGYYYVASKFRHLGAFAPEEISREVVAISFADNGTVSNVERFGLDDGRVVALSRRVTDDGIRDTTFIRQLLGSFGRIDAGTFLGDGS